MNIRLIGHILVLIFTLVSMQGCGDKFMPLPDTPFLQIPKLLNPPDKAVEVDVPVTFSWSPGRNAVSYALQVSTDSLFTTIVYDTSGLKTTNHVVSGLNLITTYYWRINAAYRDEASGWSTPPWSFTTFNYCRGVATVVYSGRTYTTVAIGTQCWLKKNLEVGTMIDAIQGQTDNGTIEKYCYDNDPENCLTYGGLYQWDEAMQYTNTPGARGICPPGWHIPTYKEFMTLRTTVDRDGNALKAIGQGTGDGTGTNTSGFSALLAGMRLAYGDFFEMSITASFWSSGEYDSHVAYIVSLGSNVSEIWLARNYVGEGFSIRCIKD